MKTTFQAIQDPRLMQFEAALAARVTELFERCPVLCGFAVQEGDLALVDLTCHPVPDRERAEAVLGEVAQMLLELADEQPEAAELLHGRTFARILH